MEQSYCRGLAMKLSMLFRDISGMVDPELIKEASSILKNGNWSQDAVENLRFTIEDRWPEPASSIMLDALTKG